MIFTILILIFGFIILIKGADWLVLGSVSIAKQYNISELVIGLTIVAFGTSAPELVVNIMASLNGYNDVTMGNIVGSNLFNLLLILGLSGMIFPIVVQIKTIWKEIPFSLMAALVLLFLANFTFNSSSLSINRADGLILLLFFAAFMFYIFKNLKSSDETLEADYKKLRPVIALLYIAFGLAALIFGSRFVVDSAIKIASSFGVSEKIIGVTIVSAGTSLPELVTSVVAAFRKKSDIAIGNIIGSNIFNVFLILGVSSIISPVTYNVSFNIDIALLAISTILLFVFMFNGKRYKLDRWEAGVLLIIYAGYMVYLLK